MPEDTATKIEHLPKWAQNHIEVLKMRLSEANAKVAALMASPGDTDTTWEDVETIRPLPRGAAIAFQTGKGYSSQIRVRVRDGVLDVNGVGRIVVQPVASNCVEITMRKEAPSAK